MKRGFRLLFTTLAVMLLCASAGALTFFPAGGVVNAVSVNVRQAPKAGAGKVAKLKEKAQVTVTGEITDESGQRWYAVTFARGSGYIQAEYLSVADEERIQAAKAGGEAVIMRATVRAQCADYNGLGKTWNRLFEINGLPVPEKGLAVTLAPDIPFSLFSRMKSKSSKSPASGSDLFLYTPSARELAEGFTVTQTVNAVNSKQREAVWTVTFTFAPAGARPVSPPGELPGGTDKS